MSSVHESRCRHYLFPLGFHLCYGKYTLAGADKNVANGNLFYTPHGPFIVMRERLLPL